MIRSSISKIRLTFFLDEKSKQKNQAKNILPPHYLTHPRIFGIPPHLCDITRLLEKGWLVCNWVIPKI
jgi:hypothetical protein